MVLTKKRLAGDIVDVFKAAEIVEFDKSGPTDAAFAPAVAGQNYYAAAGGAAEVAAPAAGVNKGKIGYTVEASRLIVDTQIYQG